MRGFKPPVFAVETLVTRIIGDCFVFSAERDPREWILKILMAFHR